MWRGQKSGKGCSMPGQESPLGPMGFVACPADTATPGCDRVPVPFQELLICVYVLPGQLVLFVAVKAKPLSCFRKENFRDRCLVDSVTGEALDRTGPVLGLPRVFPVEGMVRHYAIVLYVVVTDGAQLRLVHRRDQG